jgi:hypothetical protein
VAKIQVWVSKPSAKKVSNKYADRIAKYMQQWILKRLNKETDITAQARKGAEKTKGFQIDSSVSVRVAGGNINVAITMQVSKDDSMFAFVRGSGSTSAGNSDASNAEGAELVIAAILKPKMLTIVAQLRTRR